MGSERWRLHHEGCAVVSDELARHRAAKAPPLRRAHQQRRQRQPKRHKQAPHPIHYIPGILPRCNPAAYAECENIVSAAIAAVQVKLISILPPYSLPLHPINEQ